MPTASKKAPFDEDLWVSLRQAARILGVSRNRAMYLGMAGAFTTQKVAGRTVISRESVEKLKKDLAKAS